jgi:hypothetical protein
VKKTSTIFLVMMTASWLTSAQTFRVDSVTVDSVWNSDTVIYESPRSRRDVKVSFVPIASDSVTCFVDYSIDSGKTWNCDRDQIMSIDNKVSFRFAPGKKGSLIMRMQTGDLTNIVFRVIARKDTASIQRCWISNGIPGLAEDTSQPNHHFYYFDNTSLANSIDGYYMSYSRYGFVDGIQQKLFSTDSLYSFSTMIYDFGLMSRASSMYNSKKAEWNRKSILAGYDTTIAIAKPNLGGYSAAAHFNHFYAEINVSGFNLGTPDSTAAKAQVVRFLDYYSMQMTQ